MTKKGGGGKRKNGRAVLHLRRVRKKEDVKKERGRETQREKERVVMRLIKWRRKKGKRNERLREREEKKRKNGNTHTKVTREM